MVWRRWENGLETPSPKYWFPAKRRGWGWGPPVAWQGWVVLALFAFLVVGGMFVLSPKTNPLPFAAYLVLLCTLLVIVCWLKGEPPRWRWSKD